MASDEEMRKRDEEYATTLRALIRHENEVTNHRTTWLMVTQALLVTAASSLVKEHTGPAIAVALLGILITLSVGHSLKNSFESRQYFKRLWRERIAARGDALADALPLDGGYPGNNAITWLLPFTFIPRVFVGAWALFVLYLLWGLR